MRFDYDELFDEDYLYFYESSLNDQKSDTDAEAIVSFLGLSAGDKVLDAPCGHGRISNRLAARGVEVVGVDLTELFLGVARKAGASAVYQRGDLRNLPVDGPFDAAISWFTSFGYFDDEGNKQALAEYHRVLRPGGRLLIELHNRDEFVRRFTPAPFSHDEWVGDDVMSDTTEFDCVAGRMETDRVVIRDGKLRRMHFSIRLPNITELREWLTAAGFSSVEFFAGNGEAPSIHRPRLVVIATR